MLSPEALEDIQHAHGPLEDFFIKKTSPTIGKKEFHINLFTKPIGDQIDFSRSVGESEFIF